MTDKMNPAEESQVSATQQELQLQQLMKLAGEPAVANAQRKALHKQQLQQSWRQSVQQQRRRRWGRLMLPTGIAASLMLGVYFLVSNTAEPVVAPIAEIVYRIGEVSLASHEQRDSDDLYSGDLLVTKADGALTFALHDQTIVQLDTSTQVTLQDEGDLWLHHGRVFIDSPGDRSSVVVHTAWGTLRDTGTAFEVSVSEEVLQLAMRVGVVELTLNDPDSKVVVASASGGQGDVLTVDSDLSLTRKTRSTSSPQWRWTRDGAPAFPQGRHALVTVLEWAAHQSGRQLKYASPLVQMRVGNEFVMWPEIEAASLEARLLEISQTIDYNLEFTAAELVVIPKP